MTIMIFLTKMMMKISGDDDLLMCYNDVHNDDWSR